MTDAIGAKPAFSLGDAATEQTHDSRHLHRDDVHIRRHELAHSPGGARMNETTRSARIQLGLALLRLPNPADPDPDPDPAAPMHRGDVKVPTVTAGHSEAG